MTHDEAPEEARVAPDPENDADFDPDQDAGPTPTDDDGAPANAERNAGALSQPTSNEMP
jgi:hypothetical protein